MVTDVEDHGQTILRHWNKLVNLISDPESEYAIDGESLSLATVVAVARWALLILNLYVNRVYGALKLISMPQIWSSCNRQQQNILPTRRECGIS